MSSDGRIAFEIDIPLWEGDFYIFGGEAFVDRLRSALQRVTGKSIVISAEQDSSIIGGIVTTVGNVMYDGSLRMHLMRIREEMRNRT